VDQFYADRDGNTMTATEGSKDRRATRTGERRERSVPCRECRNATWNVDALCDRHLV
jgi:hypothetical protein